MLTYEELLKELRSNADESYRAFHKKLLKNDKIQVIGVRMPVLRAIAKREKASFQALLGFPDEFYEVTFLKCAVAALLPYGELIKVLDGLAALLDNWATCDCFKAKCIATHKEEFLPYIEKYFADGREFVRRFALVTLLDFYVEEKYLPVIFSYLRRCENEEYYVMMAAAWLLAEVLVKHYEEGRAFLRDETLDSAVKRKGIRKACESFRLSEEQKAELKQV